MDKKRSVLAGVMVCVAMYLMSYVRWQVFVVGYLGLPSCNPLQWLALWGLVVIALLVISVMVEVLRDK